MKALLPLGLLGLAATAAPVLADPLDDLLAANRGFACFDRAYDAAHLAKNPDQKTRSIRLLLTEYPSIDGASIRVSIRDKDGERHIVGECSWSDEPAMGAQGEPFIDTYKAGAGLLCHAYASSDGASAEEGGDFVAELRSPDRIILHLAEGLAGWPSYDTGAEAAFFDFGVDDRVFRIDRTEGRLCEEMDTHLPSAEDIVMGGAAADAAPATGQPPGIPPVPGAPAKP